MKIYDDQLTTILRKIVYADNECLLVSHISQKIKDSDFAVGPIATLRKHRKVAKL